ncbi:hypothetical protein BBO01nite_50570 [Brevibacillus borstelensis]|jgi:hypothetical protein|nr:hypothetical protein BBO01nite_50570 [Brevibacillus borstelensis]
MRETAPAPRPLSSITHLFEVKVRLLKEVKFQLYELFLEIG